MPENPLLTPETSVLVLIDYQAEMFSAVNSMDRALLELNVRALARSARACGVPVVLSTVGVAMGANEATVAALRDELPGVPELDRSTMNAWEDEAVRRAVGETGRRRVVFGALWTEICLAFPVLHARKEGYETYFVADAVGGTTPVAHEAAIQRMIQAGSVPLNWMGLLAEWVRDWKTPRAQPMREILRWYYGELSRAEKPGRRRHAASR